MEKNASILVVDDDKEIADLVEIYLVNDGYQVLKASDGEQCLQTLKEHPEVRMLILDIMMPGIDGLEVCREIRKTSNIPILILSAKAEDMDKIVGFGTGADDYLTKPFHPLELLARVKSQMKRYTTIQLGEEQQPASKDEIEIQDLTINKAAHVVKKNGKEVALTPIEFDILNLLVQNHDCMVSSAKLLQDIWGYAPGDDVETIRVHIRHLRTKIKKVADGKEYIETIYGGGYRLLPEGKPSKN